MTRPAYFLVIVDNVSTHMPLARHDLIKIDGCFTSEFLLTCLLRGMTGNASLISLRFFVSTHMPLARHDVRILHLLMLHILFLLTCLLRGMTPPREQSCIPFCVSTHMPLARHDDYLNIIMQDYLTFLLTCLLRGMTWKRYISWI